ncbi:unnamed protein product [Mortierella alpina]
MRLLSEGVFQRVPPEEIVKYSRECYHSIHPEFMRDQLTRSLERLNTKFVDILFVHNPEYYLMANVKGTEVNVKKHQDILLNRLSILFEELEREVDKGRIHSYGISSNSFSLKPSHAHFLPYQDLVKMATKAFERVRDRKQQEQQSYEDNLSQHERHSQQTLASDVTPASQPQKTTTPKAAARTSHSLHYLQMPGNLLEMEGVLTTAKWAKSQGLSVFLNRPLNAMSMEQGPMRLASYPAPQSPTYAEGKAQILESLSALGHQRDYLQPKMQRLKEMIEGLDASLKSDKLSIMQLEGASIRNQLHQELAAPLKVRGHKDPHPSSPNPASDTRSTPSSHAPSSARPSLHEMEELIKALDRFLRVFNQQVRFQESGRVQALMTERGIDLEGDSIERFAVEYLLEHAQVDSVLLGMKREPYVEFARDILRSLSAGAANEMTQ